VENKTNYNNQYKQLGS